MRNASPRGLPDLIASTVASAAIRGAYRRISTAAPIFSMTSYFGCSIPLSMPKVESMKNTAEVMKVCIDRIMSSILLTVYFYKRQNAGRTTNRRLESGFWVRIPLAPGWLNKQMARPPSTIRTMLSQALPVGSCRTITHHPTGLLSRSTRGLSMVIMTSSIYMVFPLAFFTAGGTHVPLMIDGDFSFGQYIRNIKTNWSFGAGSQLLSFSAPGHSF
jgi:hypothetical protein